MIPKVVSLPVRVGLRVTRTTLGLSVKLAGAVAGEVVHVVQSRFSPPAGQSAPASAEPSTSAPAGSDEPSSRTPAGPATPVPPAPDRAPVAPVEDVVSPDELPATPLTREEANAKTIDDSDELVAEFAEPGAEDGAGAELNFEEPWEGFDTETAEAVSARIAHADAAELAVLELYEQTHKQRKTVLDAAAQRLRELTPPNVG